MLVLTVCLVLFRLGAELVKTAEDHRGDIASGIATVSTVWGHAVAHRSGTSLMSLALLLAWLPAFLEPVAAFYVAMLAAGCLLTGRAWLRAFFAGPPSVAESRRAVRTNRFTMVIMALACAFGL